MSHPAQPPTHDALAEQQAFLRRLARHLVADEHQAQDLAQDSALAALRGSPPGVRSMRAWLARVARNLAANAARAERARSAHELAAPAPEAPRTPAEIAERIEAQRAVLAAFERLDEPYKSTLFLRYFDDLAPSAIAERTSVPVSTVKTRLARGLARMRAELDERHGGERGAWAVALMAGSEGWQKATIGAAAAAGGIAMGVKLAWGVAAVGGVLLGAWWATRPAYRADERNETVVAERTAETLAAGAPSALREPDPEPRSAPVATPLAQAAIREAAEQPAWLLELELRGWDAADTGPVSVEVSGPEKGSPRIAIKHELADVSVDVGLLFAATPNRPPSLHVRLDHPLYVPLDADVLVPEELRQVETQAGVLRGALTLERAKACVVGSLAVDAEVPSERVWVALYPLKEQRPADAPIDRVHPAPGGSFRLRANAADEHVVVAYAEPEQMGRSPGLRPETRPLSLVRGEERELEPIVLGEGATVAGRVLFPASAALLRGWIEVRFAEGPDPRHLIWKDGRFEVGTTETAWDEQGRFEIRGLAPRPYRLTPTVHDFRPEQPTIGMWISSFGQDVTAPALDVRIDLNVVRVAFMVTSQGAPAKAMFSVVTEEAEGNISWQGRGTSKEGRIDVLLDPASGLHCKVDDGTHAPKELQFLPAELVGGGPIEIALDELDPDSGTLAIHLGPRARELAQDVVLDVRLFDRSDPNAVDALRLSTYSASGGARVSLSGRSVRPEMEVRADRAQVITRLPPATYVVLLAPRPTDPSMPCLLLPTELEVEVPAGGRVDREWFPEVGGALRINFIGSGATRASLWDGAGEPLMSLGFRQGSGVSSGLTIPGVNEVNRALPAGAYQLRIRMDDGSTRTVPVQVEAGRVNDVEIDVDAL